MTCVHFDCQEEATVLVKLPVGQGPPLHLRLCANHARFAQAVFPEARQVALG